jgi:diguanylate cyclase (GGDEF)-like protein
LWGGKGVVKNNSTRSGARKAEGEGPGLREWRLETLADEQGRAAEDMTASDADQTESDTDQDHSDLDRELSERDQQSSDRDQAASNRDQQAADRELEHHQDAASVEAYEAGRTRREATTLERDQSAQVRGVTAEERARNAAKRDESAWHRDLTADARDNAATRRDRESVDLEHKVARRGSSLRVAIGLARDARQRAAQDRKRAAEDRAQAAQDRERVAKERAEVLAELRLAHVDELTGALRRGAGEVALQTEIERARRGEGKLVLAFVDIDSLREINNTDGHAEGDQLLQNVVAAIRANIRSYEPVVRYGGDEFVCAITGVDREQAEARFAEIRETLAEPKHPFSVGLAELGPDDTVEDLVERADKALLDTRGRRGGD